MSRRPSAPWLAPAVALLAAACASPPPAAPPLNVARTHRAGRALGEGPTVAPVAPTADPADAAAALALSVEWYWVPGALDDGLAPVGVHALAVAGSGGDQPFTATPRIVGSVRLALGEPARGVAERLRALSAAEATRLATQQDALPVGVTASFAAGPLALELSRPTAASGIELALVRDGSVPLGAVLQADTEEEGGATGAGEETGEETEDEQASALEAAHAAERATPVEWREVVLLDTPLLPDGPPAVIALPGGAPGAFLVALIEVRAAPVEGEALAQHAALLAQCLADVAESAERQARQVEAMDAAESKHRQLLAAARSMAASGDRRRAAVFLTSESAASLALDTVLVADTDELDALAAAWRLAAGTDDEQLVRGDTMLWTLERTTALWLAQRAEASALPAELEAVLLRQTGVVARAPDLLQQLTEDSADVAGWRARLEQENRDALEDSLPAWRVRGYDWLAARGLAPPGYDPLAPRAQRQAALLAADEAQ